MGAGLPANAMLNPPSHSRVNPLPQGGDVFLGDHYDSDHHRRIWSKFVLYSAPAISLHTRTGH
ncbi:hypothetical protein C1S65_23795 [Pseudomonas putida]|uniref:Uncharacterized protein n=1 Tax=Pseudomonas putida TaxID=303 RepID=A0AAD0PGK2_PSEPU|nr:hypothetical protein C1S65_23795 [Pseudomonas putida]